MIVYRNQRLRADPRRLLEELSSEVERIDFQTSASHDSVVAVLIAAGVLESGVSDEMFPAADGLDPVVHGFRQASVALGHLLWHSWHGRRAEADQWRCSALGLLRSLELHALPRSIPTSTPEGYAYYAVYPEAYLEAARRCHAVLGPVDVVCIGLRSIGTSLSAVVAAAFEELGCTVKTLTLRPRGHPFARTPVVSLDLERLLAAQPGAHFLVVDEGPGISGSSFGGTAEMLTRLGVDDTRIVLFPSHQADGTRLRSTEAQEHWRRHQRFNVSFEEVWIDSGKLGVLTPANHYHDLSAGAWRRKIFPDEQQYPPVQPEHERRKYLLAPTGDEEPEGRLFSFFGLGGAVPTKLRRARRLGEAGFAPAPQGVVHGFVVRDFVRGVPVSRGGADQELLDTLARYLDHLYREHRSEPSVGDDGLREMVAVNVAEGIGEGWEERIDAVLPGNLESWSECPVALDARMQAHEWIRTEAGYLKTDGFDHHDDHFFPGCQDIAWDLAGAVVELDLDAAAMQFLLARYRSLSGDRTIGPRLPHYAVAYLAFRLGYCKLAAEVLAETPDGFRFTAAAGRYGSLLRRTLSRSPTDRLNV